MAEQLIKKTEEGYSNVMPKSWIEAIIDKSTGESLTHILQGFNMYFLSYTGNTEQTRCQVSKILRKKGLWITYVKYDGNVYTEWYNSNNIDDKSWGNSSNWRMGNNELVGDLTISANGNWVINGNETEFRAVGEKGNTPILRVANNRLQVSYDTGDTYHNVDNNPVYTQIRTYNNKLQISTDLGANWIDASDEIAAYFRFNSGQGNNVGNIQISRNNKDWSNLSGNFVNNLHISKYIGADETLPTSGIAEGTIYAKGPTYAESDTSHSNPIYRLWVYAYKGDTLTWQDNGEFTSISAGVVQELGNSENLVVSQKCVSQEIIQGVVYDVSSHNNDAVFESLQALLSSSNLDTLIPVSVRHGGMGIKFIQNSDNKYVQYRLITDEWSTNTEDWSFCGNDVYVDNPEFIRVVLDNEGKILWAVKADGSIYYGAGIPPQIIDYINKKIAELSLDEYEDIVAFLNRLEEGDKTLQTLLNEKVDKEEGKSLIDNEYASTKSTIDNPEFLEVVTDTEDKVLEGIKSDGTKIIGGDLNVEGSAKILGNMEISGVSYKVIENPEYIAAWVDAEDKVIFGIKTDGKTYVGDADFLNDINDIKNFLQNITDKNIDWDALSSITTVENSEYIEVKTDSEGKLLAGRTLEGAAFENVGFTTPKVSIDGTTIENIEDPEERTDILIDTEGKIVSYRDKDGVKHEEVGLCLSKNALNSFVNDIKKSNLILSGNDWSDYISHDGDKPLILPKPNCARINIIAENFNISSLLKEGVPGSLEGVNYDVPTYIEFFDMNGNFFRKPIFISAQGQGSLYSAKKNLAIDLFDTEHGGDGLKIKFGDWVACDSFHLKGYYSDENKSRNVVTYQIYNDMVKTRGFFKDFVWKRGLIDEDAITPTSTGLEDTDEYINQMDNGARCFPDGFPIILYCNNDFYGLYVMQLKKDRANYKLSKKKANNLWLDTVIYDIWNMNGNLDWRIFSSTKIDTMISLRGMEIRNPKDIYCVDFTYSYEILTDGWEKTAVINKPQYTSYDGDATILTHGQIAAMNDGYPPAYLYNTETGIMYRIKQNPNGKYVKYNFDDPKKRSELIDESMSCYGKKKDGVTPLDPNNKEDVVMLANHKRSADVKKNLIALSKMYPELQALDTAYEADKTSEKLAAFKDKFEQYFDVDNLIDYQIICQLVYNWDSWGNNWLWFTYDGKKYFCGLYDCDASWGIGPNNTAVLPIDYFIGQKMFVMMIKYYKERLVSRYKYLRDLKIIDRDSIMNKFLSFHHAWGSEYFEQEFKKWSQSTIKDSLGRIAKWIDANIANMDALYINN